MRPRSSTSVPAGGNERRRRRARAGGARAARARPVPGSERRLPAAATTAPGDAAIQTAWGELFLEKYNNGEALKSFQDALQADPNWAPALLGSARALADENPPQAMRARQAALEINPSIVDAHVFLAERGRRRGHSATRRARRSRRRSTSTRRASRRTRCSRRSPTSKTRPPEFEAEVAKALAIAPNYGEVYRVAGELAAHNYRFDEAVDARRAARWRSTRATRARSPTSASHLLRTGDEPGARDGARSRPSSSIRSTSSRFNLLEMMDTLDKFVTVRDGDLVSRMHKDEAPVLQDYALPLAHQALDTLSARYEFTPQGPDPHRDLPEARRLRGPQRRPARHDRRARRLLRPRGDAGFAAGAAAGRVPVGGDALARAGARHHAADVEPARAALADRRHLGLRGEAARGPSGAAAMDIAVRRHAEPRRDDEAPRSERGVHEPADDLARLLPGVAARRASRHRPTATPACTSCCAPTARASTPTRR